MARRNSNPARSGPPSHGPREQGEAATFPAASPDLLTPEANAFIARPFRSSRAKSRDRRADQASLLLILLAALWFATASFGASVP